MKNILILTVIVTILVGCRKTDLVLPENRNQITNDLVLTSPTGIKLQSSFVKDEVLMNVKLEKSDNAVIKIMDISNRVISKEEVSVIAGNNLLKMYTTTLPKSAYRIGLYDLKNNLIGIADFNKL